MERRTFQRVPLERVCTIRRDRPSLAFWNGTTHNIGRGGALISIGANSGMRPGVGDEVTVELLLDPNGIVEQRCIQCRGYIVRVDDEGVKNLRLGVHFDWMTIRPASPAFVWNDVKMVV